MRGAEASSKIQVLLSLVKTSCYSTFQLFELVTTDIWGGGCSISMEITALTLPGFNHSHSLIFTFITAASAFPWGSQHNQLHQNPLSGLANSYPSTYPNGLWALCPKLYLLITSGLQDKFHWGGQSTFWKSLFWSEHLANSGYSWYE